MLWLSRHNIGFDPIYSRQAFQADTLIELASKLDSVDAQTALNTMQDFNRAVDPTNAFDPTILDGRCTTGLPVNKTNWANTLEVPPFKAFPVTCGITFTYAGLRVDQDAMTLALAGADRNSRFVV